MGEARAKHGARRRGMEWFETAGGEREGAGTREPNQGERAASRGRRKRNDRISEQLGLHGRRCPRGRYRRLTLATLRDQVLLRKAEQVLRGVIQIQPGGKIQE